MQTDEPLGQSQQPAFVFARKWFPWLLRISGFIALSFAITILAFYFHAAYLLGYFPTPENPDPGTLPIYSFYYPIFNITSDAWGYSLIVWLFVTSTLFVISPERKTRKLILISFLGHFAVLLTIFTGIAIWIID